MRQLVTYASHIEDPTAYAFAVFDSIESTEKFFLTAQIYFEMFPGSPLQTIYLACDEFVEYTNYKEFRNDFEVRNITDVEYIVLYHIFGDAGYYNGLDVSFGHTKIFKILECFGDLPYEEKPELVKELADLYPECNLAFSGEDSAYIL